MPRKNAKKRDKAIRAAMGNLRRRKNPALERAEKAVSKTKRAARAAGPQSLSGGYSSDDSSRVVSGIFSYSGRGYGFCTPDGTDDLTESFEDVFIPPRQTKGAMTGDLVTVSAEPTGTREDGRRGYEGEVLTVEHVCRSVIGTLRRGRGYAYVVPDSKRWNVTIAVPEKDADVSGAKDGWKVEVVPSEDAFFVRGKSVLLRAGREVIPCEAEGRIASVFGDGLTKDANYAAILTSCGIRTEFPESVLASADEAAAEPVDPELNPARVDLRDHVIFTIDGAGAKDLDDAISLEKRGENWVLGVHIADVSHYVRPDTPVEKEAALRGTSVYFTDKVVPMLPESLSNGACSLNAGEDRYAMTAEVTLDGEGNRLGTKIFKSVIRSRVRGVYTEVNDLFERGAESAFAGKYAEVLPMLTDMLGLYRTLAARAKERGVLELEDSEAVILLDENGEPAEIVKAERGDGEKLIEQFMLQANMGVAETLLSLELPCLYRVHAKPDAGKIAAFAVFAASLGLGTYGIALPDSGEKEESSLSARELILRLGKILADAEERGMGPMVSLMLLRSLMKAKYQSTPAHHFGLGADVYCHFTSPIRRYPDLFVHSVITAVLEQTGAPFLSAERRVPGHPAAKFEKIAAERGFTSTECEIRAMDAEREIEDLYMTLYMAKHIGEEFDAAVTGVAKSGLFVRCENLAEGFVPAENWPGARIDEEHMTLTSRGITLTLGSPLRVVLTEADPGTRRITFAAADAAQGRGE